ncbi:hypothetical protein ACFYVL_21155 [Streptomyces sp. NPDC004111]|uniref:hypothetical protein n=1 Tax=Streptomyces sp. NPDC004111 TaxID=3364690 RepID=UPI0036C86892
MTSTKTTAAEPAEPSANRPRLRRVTTAGSALAVALGPVVVGVLVAKGMAADPHAPVNALFTGGGERVGLPRGEWRRRRHATARRLRTARRGTARRCAAVCGRRTSGPLREPAGALFRSGRRTSRRSASRTSGGRTARR